MVSLDPHERSAAQCIPETPLRPLRVLAVIDGSERTGRVIEFALRLARDGARIEAILLGVVPKPPDGRLRGYGSFKRKEIESRLAEVLGARAVAAAARRLDQAGIVHHDRTELGAPAETILRVAEEDACDIIVLGDTRAGALRRWLSKVAGLAVATVACEAALLAPIPVVVVK
ncbi:MAG TPA: universal stress protein [Hyphomicrobiaceae bacterium]|jgi:nucleotide-binding universal stress UspA family protein|nr:universal stress protein [Hyphomicrobiaceae bacterium]